MRRVLVGRVLAMVALAALVAGPAAAQDKEIVVAGGYAPQWVKGRGTIQSLPVGLFVNVAGSVAPSLQIVGDLGWGRKDGYNLTTFTGGVRYLLRAQSGGKAMPFVEGLVGGHNFTGSDTGIAIGLGGGVDVKAYQSANLRFQVNYFLDRIAGVNVNEVRFGIGISTSKAIK